MITSRAYPSNSGTFVCTAKRIRCDRTASHNQRCSFVNLSSERGGVRKWCQKALNFAGTFFNTTANWYHKFLEVPNLTFCCCVVSHDVAFCLLSRSSHTSHGVAITKVRETRLSDSFFLYLTMCTICYFRASFDWRPSAYCSIFPLLPSTYSFVWPVVILPCLIVAVYLVANAR